MAGTSITRLVCSMVVLAAVASAACDLNGDWVVVHFSDFDTQSFSVVNVVVSDNFLSVQCQSGACLWHTAYGSFSGPSMSVTTEGGQVISGVIHQKCDAITTGIPEHASQNWLRVRRDITKAHLVFMTHLDVGYTLDTSMQVIEEYRAQWFPKAYNTAAALPTQFKWTTHPWLVMELLHNATGTVTDQDISQLKSHLAAGSIQYHAGPFNIQSEMYSAGLYGYALNISRQLDAMFGKPQPTITLSQKDVPGMTRAAVPQLAAAGIKAIHIGVNDFSTPPAVPVTSPEYFGSSNIFWWNDTATATSVLAYYASSYSQGSSVPEMVVTAPGFDEALVFLFHVDNTGPQDPAQVLLGWNATSLLFPGAQLVASSLDDFTRALLARPDVTSQLPTVTAELGDSWIYGCSSDPAKVRHYRALSRERDNAISNKEMTIADPRVDGFSRNLAKLGEHTWGNNEGSVFTADFSNTYFDTNYKTSAFQEPLSSFVDQRSYIGAAFTALADHPLASRLQQAVADSDPFPRSWHGYTPLSPVDKHVTCFPGTDAWIDSTGNVWVSVAGQNILVASLFYVTHSEDDFVQFIRNYSLAYMRNEEINLGFDKYGLGKAGAVHSETQALPSVAASFTTNSSCDLLFNLTLPSNLQTQYGAPGSITLALQVSQWVGDVFVDVDLQWDHKRATRMAESIWLTMAPGLDHCGQWQLNKIGEWISPYDMVINGSRNMHAVDYGVQLVDKQGVSQLLVQSLDAAVVATTERNPIRFSMDPDYINTNGGMHFSLFNNAWNTNYPVWSQDPSDRFRFRLLLRPDLCKTT